MKLKAWKKLGKEGGKGQIVSAVGSGEKQDLGIQPTTTV